MKRIYLIGYMGAGKTTLGKIVSRQLGLSFIDLDLYIEGRQMKSISDLFQEKGESGFREIERQALLEVSEFEDVLIATGGGTPCFFDNAEVMNQTGISVYLKTDPTVLFGRLRIARQSRPILKSKTDEELLSFIETNLEKREPYYQKASIIFDANELESAQQITQTSERLSQLLKNE